MVSTTAGQNPVVQARFAAITQLAVFEAVNAIDKDFDPYLGTVAAPRTASAEAAAVAAAHAVLKNYFPANAAALDAARAASLSRIADGIPKQQGLAVGAAAAAAMVALRTDDGSAPPEFYVTAPADAGEWQLKPSSRYARDYNEVKRVGGVYGMYRSQERADVARFYAQQRRFRCGMRQPHKSPLRRGARCPRTRGCSRWSTWRSAMRSQRCSRRSITITSGAPRGHSCRRCRRQSAHAWKSRLRAVRADTVLPELCIGARQLECRGT